MYKGVMKNILFNVLGQAVKGRALWKKIIAYNNINLEKDFVILVSKEEQQCSYYTLLYLNKFIEWLELRKNKLENHNIPVIRRNERFLVLTDDPDVLKYAKKISRRVTYVEFLKCEELDNIIKYYSIYPYTDRLLDNIEQFYYGIDKKFYKGNEPGCPGNLLSFFLYLNPRPNKYFLTVSSGFVFLPFI